VGSAVLECEHPTAHQYQATDLDRVVRESPRNSAPTSATRATPTAEPAYAADGD